MIILIFFLLIAYQSYLIRKAKEPTRKAMKAEYEAIQHARKYQIEQFKKSERSI